MGYIFQSCLSLFPAGLQGAVSPVPMTDGHDNLYDKVFFYKHAGVISACHVGIDGATPGAHPLAVQFLKGICSLRPVSKPIAPIRDLGAGSLGVRALGQ